MKRWIWVLITVVVLLAVVLSVMFLAGVVPFRPTGEVVVMSTVGIEGDSIAPVTGGVITGGAITVEEGNGVLSKFWRWVSGN